MDLVTAALVMLRRWYLTIPGVLVAVGLALGAWTYVAPSYEATGSLLLRPPPSGNDPDTGQVNPYLSYNTLQVPARVTTDVLNQPAELEALVEGGATGEFAVALDPTGSSPLVVFTATGDSEAEATSTAEAAMTRFSEILEDRQLTEGSSEEKLIVTETVTAPGTATRLDGSRTRAALGAGLCGALLTLVVVFTTEAVSRRRRARDAGVEQGPAAVAADARTAEAAPTASLVVCPLCHATVATADLGRHVAAEHQPVPERRAPATTTDQPRKQPVVTVPTATRRAGAAAPPRRKPTDPQPAAPRRAPAPTDHATDPDERQERPTVVRTIMKPPSSRR